MNIQIIKDAMDALMMQRSSLDQEQGTDNDKIDAAQKELDKLERLFAVSDSGLAQVLYMSYCEAVGGVAYDGKPLPSWQEFSTDPTKKKQTLGWMAAAHAVRQ
jgi:hypothetical protein